MPNLDKILSQLKDIPTLPTVVLSLNKALSDASTSAADINGILAKDPSLTARILRLVNSSYYGFSRRITNVTNAVVIIGYNQVRNLALSSFVFDTLRVKSRYSIFDMEALWKHSLGAAFLATNLAKKLKSKCWEDAFICGLLHDIGKGIMTQYALDDMTLVMNEVIDKDILFYQAEKNVLTYSHVDVGFKVMEKWNLPATLVDVVHYHHDPLSAPTESRELVAITNFSDILSRAMLLGSGGDCKIPYLEPSVWEFLGLSWSDIESLMRTTASEFWKADEFISIG